MKLNKLKSLKLLDLVQLNLCIVPCLLFIVGGYLIACLCGFKGGSWWGVCIFFSLCGVLVVTVLLLVTNRVEIEEW